MRLFFRCLCLLSFIASGVRAQAPLPPSLLNRNLLPASPEAAALGRFGAVPVSLYTGVPSIDIPLFSLPGRTVSVPLSLQYHGGGIRPDQVAPWTGMNWTLNAGGVITRTCRGLPDYGNYFVPSSRPVPLGISLSCRNQSDNTDGTDYYQYIEDILSGQRDSQPDLFTFNFLGYSGQIIFDQQGKAYTIPAQALDIRAPHGPTGDDWVIKTPDGATYTFGAAETTVGPSTSGPSAWYLTRIVSAQDEQVELLYQEYTTELTYPNEHTTTAISTQTVFMGPYHCETCPRLLTVSDRPTSRIQGKYLRRIVSATHRVDLLSTATRLDQPGARQLNTVRLTYLADSSRYQEFRLRYGYYNPAVHDRLFLQELQKVGVEATGREVAEPPHAFTYVPPGSASPLRGTYATDRWGYYNAAPNFFPFPRSRTQNFQVLSDADRETNPAAVTFGLLRAIRYPMGGTTTFDFEANDFSNFAGLFYESDDSTQTATAHADGSGAPPTQRAVTFHLTHDQQVRLTYSASPTGANTAPVTSLQTSATLYALGNPTPLDVLSYPAPPAPSLFLRSLPAGTYRLVVDADAWQELTAQLRVDYVHRRTAGTKKQLGGGTRIRRVVTYDGLDHARDQTKEYSYDNDRHTRSTGRLIHQPVFHTTSSYIRVNQGGDKEEGSSCFIALGQEWYCYYMTNSADDMAAASGAAQGSAVGYDTVTVVERKLGTTHRSTSVFHNLAAGTIDLTDQAIENQGFIPLNFDTQNGLLQETLDYAVRTNGDAFRAADRRVVRRVVYQYGSPAVPDTDIVGLSVGGSFGDLKGDSREPCRTIVAQSYRTRVGWWPLTQTEETRYDAAGRAHTTTTRTLYESAAHLQPSRKEVVSSDGTTQVTRYKYALDYVPVADPGIRLLQERHMVDAPVEQQQWVRPASGPAYWLGGTVTQYAATLKGAVPQQLYQATLAAPRQALTEATAADHRYTALLPDPAYALRARLRHTPQGTLATQSLVHERPTAYLWGYHDLRPIAEVRNAAVEEVAFTSFEANATGRWQYDSLTASRFVAPPFTGQRGYELNGTTTPVRRPALPAGDYDVVVWAHGAGVPRLTGGTGAPQYAVGAIAGTTGWRQHRFRVHVPANGTVELNAPPGQRLWIDELRLCPTGARMTTLTMDGLGGTTSQTDPSGRTTTYEYDALGRLLRTRDEQGRILSQQQYHYVQP